MTGSGLDAAQALSRMILGGWTALAVRAMADLRLADHLAEPLGVKELAQATMTDASSLARLLRALNGLGLVARTPDGNYVRTAVGELLRSDHPRDPRSKAMLFTEPHTNRAWERLADAVRIGAGVFEAANGVGFWDYLEQNPREAATLDAAMAGHGVTQAQALLEACDFTAVTTVIDVGGGKGGMLSALLEARPSLRAVLADRAEVVAAAPSTFDAAGIHDRWEAVPTDFFKEVPKGGDAYVLAQILHDWPDEQCRAILGVVREAMPPHARLWLIEEVLPAETAEPDGADDAQIALHLLDLTMLVCFGAQERTAQEYEELLRSTGFADVSVSQTASGWSVIEALPAGASS